MTVFSSSCRALLLDMKVFDRKQEARHLNTAEPRKERRGGKKQLKAIAAILFSIDTFYYVESILLPEHASALGWISVTHLPVSAESRHARLQTCGCIRCYVLKARVENVFIFPLLPFLLLLARSRSPVVLLSPPSQVVISVRGACGRRSALVSSLFVS